MYIFFGNHTILNVMVNDVVVLYSHLDYFRYSSQDKDIKWDETNILQTLHPADKDYGHMKIEEPKTPYSYFVEDDDGQCHSDNEMAPEIDPDKLSKLIDKTTTTTKSKFTFDAMEQDDSDQSDFEEIENETEEERMRRKEFEQKRKKHYNEYQMVKLARKLLKDEMDEIEDEED